MALLSAVVMKDVTKFSSSLDAHDLASDKPNFADGWGDGRSMTAVLLNRI